MNPSAALTLVKFQRWMKCLATSRAAFPWTTEAMSCQGILGVVCLSMKSEEQKVGVSGGGREVFPPRRAGGRTVEGFLQLDPVPVHKVAVVLPVPEARFPEQLADARLQTANRAAS